MTRQLGQWCKRTGVSQPVVMLHSLYICHLVRLTPYACSPAIDDRVPVVVVRECNVVFGSVFGPRPILGWMLLQYSVVTLELNIRIYRVCVQILVAFHPA